MSQQDDNVTVHEQGIARPVKERKGAFSHWPLTAKSAEKPGGLKIRPVHPSSDAAGRAAARCFWPDNLPGGELVIHATKQHYGNGSFLVARTTTDREPDSKAALRSLYEGLLDGCKAGNASSGRSPLFVDVGPGDGDVAALASSLGCPVLAFDPEATDTEVLKITRCINSPPTPFDVVSGAPRAPELRLSAAAGLETGGKARQNVTLDEAVIRNSTQSPEVAILRIVPHSSVGADAVLQAMRGAHRLFHEGRVRCFAVELNFDEKSTGSLLEILHGLEATGFRLMHLGPLDRHPDSPELDIGESGSHPLFHTDTAQLQELHADLLRIRNFDMRSGTRVYANGISLDREGHFFDYKDLVVGCRGELPSYISVNEKANLRFRDGTWWPERE